MTSREEYSREVLQITIPFSPREVSSVSPFYSVRSERTTIVSTLPQTHLEIIPKAGISCWSNL